MVVLDPKTKISAQILKFANGRKIYCLSSNPNLLLEVRAVIKRYERITV
jgi:phage FluMu gp28-like protein